MTQWWNDTGEFAAFGRWLTDTGQLHDPWEMVEKPWKWESEHAEYLREMRAEQLADLNDEHLDRWAL